MATVGKFGIKKLATSSGSLGVFDITSDSDVRIIVENAGPTNIVAVYGKIQGQNSYELIDTVVGATSKLIPVNLFDFLELEVVVYDSTGIYVDIAGSGFISSTGSGGSPSGLVTVTNFPSTQNVNVTNTPTVNTGLNPLTDAQLRAAPVVITGTVNANTGLLQGLTDAELRAAPVAVTGTVNTISGFATEAKQDTQISVLNDIKTNSDSAATAQNQLDTITAIEAIDAKIEAENIRQRILKSADRESYLTYADFGTKNQRVTKIEYLTSTIPANTASKVISYTLVGTKYKRDSINWIIT